jgi:hypothetical protein
MPVIIEQPGLNNNALIGTKGLTQFVDTSGSIGRGMHVMDNILYSVNGTNLYKIEENGTVTNIGSIEGTKRVTTADNGSKLCIVVPGGKAYVYDSSDSTLVEITDPDYRASDTVIFNDGFYVFTATAGDVFFISNLNNPEAIDALDFGSSEVDPDKIIASHVDHNELYILNELTTEIFQNRGGAGFPYQRIEGAIIQKGCLAKYTPIEFDNTFVFIGAGEGEGAAVWKVINSQTAAKLSTDAIDRQIQKYNKDELSEAFSFTFSDDGQVVVGFTIDSTRIDSITLCYNAGSQQWFQMQSGINPNRWRINGVIRAYDKLICDDSSDGRIGYLSETYDEYGETILRQRTTQPFMASDNSQYWSEIELIMETGVGLTSGLDPKIDLSYSDDSGRTFSAPKSKSFGKIGNYKQRPIWRRLGRVPFNRVYRFSSTDPVKTNIIRLDGVVEQGYG